MPTRKPASHADVVQAIKAHEDTMHKDLSNNLATLRGTVASLSQDINATSKAVLKNGEQVQAMAKTMKQFIDAKNGLGLISDGIIYVGRVCFYLSIIAGTIWAALHFGSKP